MDKKLLPQGQKSVPALIQRHLLKQEQSSKTIKAYCQEKHILPSTFYGWRKRYRKRLGSAVRTEGPEHQITFASLGSLRTQVQQQALFEIRYLTGISICVYTGTTAQELAPFLSLLSGSNASC